MSSLWRKKIELMLTDMQEYVPAWDVDELREYLAFKDREVEGLRRHITLLRKLIAELPLTEYSPSETLQAWYDEMKEVMEETSPESRGDQR